MSQIRRAVLLVGFALCTSVVNLANAADPVIVLVRVFPTQGREDELQAQYLKRIEYLRKAEPGATFRLHRSAKEPITFLWYEVYESQAAYDNHLKIVMPAYRKEAGPTPEGLLAKPSESEAYSELGK